jgi:hypothetical protein
MLLVLSRVLLFSLLIVDWVEDPHFGNYLFSRPLASSDVSPLDLGFRQGKNYEEAERSLEPRTPVANFVPLPTAAPSIPHTEKPITVDDSLYSMYVFMSWQL